MKEIKAIINAYENIDHRSARVALATVVRVEGSSYRRTGARMLIADDGVWVGGISGGCLEGDALKRARLAIAKSESSLVTYDTTDDDAYQIGVGLGCNGIIDVLFTPLDPANKHNPVEVLKSCVRANRQTHVLVNITATSLESSVVKAGEVIPFIDTNSLKVLGNTTIIQNLETEIAVRLEQGRSASWAFQLPDGQKLAAFIEILLPEIHLVLMGHQYDIYPLARQVREVGWRVSMVSKLQKVNAKLLDTVDALYDFNQWNQLPIDAYTAIVLMAHDFQTDKLNLPKALQSEAFYIGMLGPRVRAGKIFDELNASGQIITDADMDRIYAPAGLDIGALSPEEIALAIIAEVKAVFAKREGGFLRLRHLPIHERT